MAALLLALLQALLVAVFGKADGKEMDRLHHDLSRYQSKDRAKRLEKELMLQRRKYEAVVTLFIRLQEELKRVEKANESHQVSTSNCNVA
jgi:hypothetical protein